MTDVVVVGAGIVGAAVARELAVRGVGVTLLDRGAVSSGTTGLGEGNVLCSDKDAGPELELARAGLALFGELEERLGDEARIRRKGALIVHPDAATWAAEPARLERIAIPGARLVGAGEVRELEPELTGELHGASLFPDDLQCDPAAIARALAREAAQAGATIREGCAVETIALAGVERGGASGDPARPIGVRVAGGETISARAVVIAAGPWSAPLAAGAGVGLPLEPRKGQLVRLAAPEPGLVAHKVVDASYLRSVASAAAGSSSRPSWRPAGRGTSSSARRASGAASTPPSTRPSATRSSRAPRGCSRGSRGSRSPPRGPDCARGCPTACPRSGRRARSPGSGSRPATRAPASRSDR